MNFGEMDSWHKHLRGISNLEKELEKNEVLKSYYEQLMKFYRPFNQLLKYQFCIESLNIKHYNQF